MWIKNITINDCRLLNSVSLEFSPDLNIIVGPNASGKTSLLEALNILSKGRSFRTSHIKEVISDKKDSILVSAGIIDTSNSNHDLSNIGIEKSSSKTKIRINKQDVYTQAELSSYLPITVIHPNSIDLITGSPAIRRSYLDWIAFYVFPDFLSKWKKYQHILRQRNICLKSSKHAYSLDKWTEELVLLQPDLIRYRSDVIKLLQPIVNEIGENLLNGLNIQLELKTGFPKDQKLDTKSLLEYYKQKQEYEFKVKRTTAGSHRADFNILLNSTPAMESASRGQLKLLAICLLLAQSNSISITSSGQGVLLIDDLAAELDTANKELLLKYLSKLDKQLIITSTNIIEIAGVESKVFHVKHGSFTSE
ncbi:MAG: DNA replication and repair protein RecF [Cocleimonas sp.]